MNIPSSSSYPNNPLHNAPVPRSHRILTGEGIKWNMFNSPDHHQYQQCVNDQAFPAEKLKNITISIPSPVIPGLSLPPFEISKEHPLTVGDIIDGLYENVNASMKYPENMEQSEKFRVDVARQYRASNTKQLMRESYNASDLNDLRTVDFFCLVSCFGGLEYGDGVWKLNVVTDWDTLRNIMRVCQGYVQELFREEASNQQIVHRRSPMLIEQI